MRSSHLARSSVFHARRLTCQVPRRKAVMGMMAGGGVFLLVVVLGECGGDGERYRGL